MSQEINRPGLAEILRRTLGMRSSRSPAGLLSPEVMPVLALEVDRPEWSILGGEYRVGAYENCPLDAATAQGAFQVLNPSASGVLAVVDHLFVSGVSGIACYNLGVGAASNTGTTTSGGFGAFDARWDDITVRCSPLLWRFRNSGWGTWTLLNHQDSTVARETMDLIPRGYPVILPPGMACAVLIDADANGHTFELAAQARVRAMVPDESV